MADALNAFDYSTIDNWVFMTFNLEPAVRLIGRKRVELSRAAQSLKWLKVSFLKQANSPRLYYGVIVKQGMELRDIIDTVRTEGLQGAGKKLGRRVVYKPTSLFTRIHSEPKLDVEGAGTITDFPYKFLLVVPRAEFIAKGMGLHAITRQIPGPLLVDSANNPVVDATGAQMRGQPQPGLEVGSLFPTKNGGFLSSKDMTIETPFNLDLFDIRVSVGLNRVSE